MGKSSKSIDVAVLTVERKVITLEGIDSGEFYSMSPEARQELLISNVPKTSSCTQVQKVILEGTDLSESIIKMIIKDQA